MKRGIRQVPLWKRGIPGDFQVKEKGFTLIELLLVVSLIAVMLSVSLPVSYRMYGSYKASVKAQEVLLFISRLRRESFLYSESKVLSSRDGVITVNGEEKVLNDTCIQIDSPIEFYRNGATSGGRVNIYVSDQTYSLDVQAPLGELILERTGA